MLHLISTVWPLPISFFFFDLHTLRHTLPANQRLMTKVTKRAVNHQTGPAKGVITVLFLKVLVTGMTHRFFSKLVGNVTDDAVTVVKVIAIRIWKVPTRPRFNHPTRCLTQLVNRLTRLKLPTCQTVKPTTSNNLEKSLVRPISLRNKRMAWNITSFIRHCA